MIEMLNMQERHGTDHDHHAHEHVLEAIIDRDAAAARTLSRTHLTSLQQKLSPHNVNG